MVDFFLLWKIKLFFRQPNVKSGLFKGQVRNLFNNQVCQLLSVNKNFGHKSQYGVRKWERREAGAGIVSICMLNFCIIPEMAWRSCKKFCRHHCIFSSLCHKEVSLTVSLPVWTLYLPPGPVVVVYELFSPVTRESESSDVSIYTLSMKRVILSSVEIYFRSLLSFFPSLFWTELPRKEKMQYLERWSRNWPP